MAVDISTQLAKIRNAVYGADVRESIASALEDMAALVNFDEQRLEKKEIDFVKVEKRTRYGRLWGDCNNDNIVNNSDVVAFERFIEGGSSIFADAVRFFDKDPGRTEADLLAKLLTRIDSDSIVEGGQIIARVVITYRDNTKAYAMTIMDD